MRKPFQGIVNIIRFNWHLYAIAIVFSVALFYTGSRLIFNLKWTCFFFATAVLLSTLISLFVSYYVYDYSSLYSLNWLNNIIKNEPLQIININAGFDETSELLQQKYLGVTLTVFDFYDPQKHTEISIKRARKAYSAFEGTVKISTSDVPLDDDTADCILLVFAAHEIRNDLERAAFFCKLSAALKPGGIIIVTEHLRDVVNFLAYNIGSFHFLSEKSWKQTFNAAGLHIKEQHRINPFVTNFTLTKNGIAT